MKQMVTMTFEDVDSRRRSRVRLGAVIIAAVNVITEPVHGYRDLSNNR